MKKEPYGREMTGVQVPVKNPPLIDREAFAKILDEQLGIGMLRTKAIVSMFYDTIEEAMRTGKAVHLGKSVLLEPVTVTETVEHINGYYDVLRVYPEHKDYRLNISKRFRDSIFGKVKPKFALRGTHKFIEWDEANRRKASQNAWKNKLEKY